MPLRSLCSFCNLTVEPGELDPCTVTVASNSDRDAADRRSQVIHGHYACLRRATSAVGSLCLEASCSPREMAEERAQEATTLAEFAESWLSDALIKTILNRPRGAWSTLRALTPDLADTEDISLDDLYVTWTDDPSAGRRFLEVPRALLLFHCEGADWNHSLLLDIG